MLTKEELPACPVATTVQLVGSKWKLLILRNLLARPWRFNELKKNLEEISQKVLTDSLRSLEMYQSAALRRQKAKRPHSCDWSVQPAGVRLFSAPRWQFPSQSGKLLRPDALCTGRRAVLHLYHLNDV